MAMDPAIVGTSPVPVAIIQVSPNPFDMGASGCWYYLDPSGVSRGPFNPQQMHMWLQEGYFNQ